jgi:low affinity Fe/Cu permease
MSERFRRSSMKVAGAIGTPTAFLIALLFVVAWALTGPIFGFSDTWQLIINTSTTVVTFLMVFIIQTTQNHDARAIHLKLDELIRALKEARTGLVDLEELPDEAIAKLEKEFRKLRLQEQTR